MTTGSNRLSKQELLSKVLEGLDGGGFTTVSVSDDHPFDVEYLAEDGQRHRLRVYMWNITYGGYPRSPDERRIQITGVDPPLDSPEAGETFLGGWDDELGALVAFDPDAHRTFSTSSPSIQISRETLEEAVSRGLARQVRGNGEVAVALRPELVGFYATHQSEIHRTTAGAFELETDLATAASGSSPEPTPRDLVTQITERWARDHGFRVRVLDAYGWTCAVCGLQLDLLEAAHILPVAVVGSTDETKNGLALCPNHHKAYDRGLVGVGDDFDVLINHDLLDSLEAEGRGVGRENLLEFEGQTIRLPTNDVDKPDPEYLVRGLEVRGWSATGPG